MILTDRWDEFRQRGIHIVPVNGKSYLLQPLVIAQGLRIPVFTLFDADGGDEKNKDKHERNNKTLLGLLGGDTSNPFPEDTLWGDRYVIWPDNITKIIKNEIPSDKLEMYTNKANALYGYPGDLHKNILYIGTKLKLAFDDGIRLQSLDKLCDAILAAAEASN
jgi:hypothetical protein